MAMDDLLKEAIADAKAVRETAMANAKAALEEAFAPKLQSMLNATLQNENDVEGEDEEELNFEQEPTAGDIEGEEVPEPYTPEEGEFELEDELDETSEEFSLENIVKELEEEAACATEEEPMDAQEEPQEELDEANSSTEFGTADNKKPSGKASSANTDDPQNSIKPNHPAAKLGGHGEINESDEEVNLEELINELKAEYSEVTDESDMSKEVTELKSSLQEHRNVIKFLRSKLNEVNLLNAKLLFTNKLFKNHALNESQKLRIIETLDRATTLKECKLVYSTLEEAYNGMKTSGKSKQVKKIVESLASKSIESTKPSKETTKNIINEGADLAARFKKLAGITK